MLCSEIDAKLTVTKRATPVSSGVVISDIEILGAASSSVIVNSPIASLKVTLLGLVSVTVTVSFVSSKLSAKMLTGMF